MRQRVIIGFVLGTLLVGWSPQVATTSASMSAAPAAEVVDPYAVLLRLSAPEGGATVRTSTDTARFDVPIFTLYADGTAIYRPPTVLPSPLPLLDPLGFREAFLDPAQVNDLLAFAAGPGGLAAARSDYPVHVAPASSQTIDATIGGATRQVRIWGDLALLPPAVDAADVPERAALGALIRRLSSFIDDVTAGQATDLGPYRPENYRLVLGVSNSRAVRTMHLSGWPVDRPLPADFRRGASGALTFDITAHKLSSFMYRPFPLFGGFGVRDSLHVNGTNYIVWPRPLLPDEIVTYLPRPPAAANSQQPTVPLICGLEDATAGDECRRAATATLGALPGPRPLIHDVDVEVGGYCPTGYACPGLFDPDVPDAQPEVVEITYVDGTADVFSLFLDATRLKVVFRATEPAQPVVPYVPDQPPFPTSIDATGVACWDRSRCLVVGGSISGGGSARIVRTTVAGLAWASIPLTGPRLTSVAVNWPGRAWVSAVCASGAPASCRSGVFYSFDSGQYWRLMSRTAVTSLTFVDIDRGWAVPASGERGFLSTVDAGRTWIHHSDPCPAGARSVSISFVDRQHGFIGCAGRSTVLATSDGGQTWSIRSNLSGSLAGLAMQSPTNGVLWEREGRTLRTTNGGRTWTSVQSAASRAGATSPDAWWLVGPSATGGQILERSDDLGSTWGLVTVLPSP
jgi:hypothetical protein